MGKEGLMKRERVTLASLDHEILEWLARGRGSANEELIAEMIQTVFRLVTDQTSRGDLKILNRALKELRYAFKIFAPYRTVRKTSIFGSARISEDNPYYEMAVDFSHRLTDEGFMVITGAGDGIMQAGHKGAGRERSFGVNIRLPFEQKPNRFIRSDNKLISFHFFFTRKLIFVKETDAVVFFPGGFGTHDEAIEILTLVQTGKSQIIPIIFLDLPDRGYWQEWHSFVQKRMLAEDYISVQDLNLFKIFDNSEAALQEIKNFYRNFHSYRFVNRDLIIRVVSSPTPDLLKQLNGEFQDILTGDSIRQTDPLPEESDNPETHKFHRLLVPFNRRDFGRLRQMIDVINSQP
jgi:uncharacterized protein (TIGR00730 family)